MRCQRRQLPFLDPWHYPLGPRRLLLDAMRRAGRHSRLYSFFTWRGGAPFATASFQRRGSGIR
jgi:hypothetical protein